MGDGQVKEVIVGFLRTWLTVFYVILGIALALGVILLAIGLFANGCILIDNGNLTLGIVLIFIGSIIVGFMIALPFALMEYDLFDKIKRERRYR
jgi:hypothetical protein